MSLLWEILICTIPCRHDRLTVLLAELDSQHLAGMGVRLYRDNLDVTIAAKRQALLDASDAEYTCFFDDDDLPPPWYTARIMQALQERPDYVGFRVRYIVDGTDTWLPVDHSLRFSGWWGDAAGLYRDITHLNPIRRELALAGRFEGDAYSEDFRWAAMIRASGRVTEEAYVPAVMYWYRYSTTDNSRNARYRRVPAGEVQPLPGYPWLTVLAAPGSC